MNLKSLLIVIFAFLILYFPCVSGNLTFIEKNQVIDNENPLSNGDSKQVIFCYGKIKNPYDFGSGYNHWIWTGFQAIDVICVFNHTHWPSFYHVVNASLFISYYWWGSITSDFICATSGFIPPRILLLFYYIQQN